MLAQIQDHTYKAYVALQSYATAPSNIPIPGVIRTDRPKLTRAQMADRYLKSVEGNPNIDINKANIEENQKMPRMVQKSESMLTERQWPTAAHPEATDEMKARQTSRTLLDWDPRAPFHSVAVYLRNMQERNKLAYEVFGVTDKNSVYMKDIPEFVVCGDQYLSESDLIVGDYPSREVQYRMVPVNNDFKHHEVLVRNNTSAEKINADIHENLNINKATRFYLTAQQLDNYLAWRLIQGADINFRYIRVEDGEQYTNRNLGYALPFMVGTIACMAGIFGCMVYPRKMKENCQATNDVSCCSVNWPHGNQIKDEQHIKRNGGAEEIIHPDETNAPSVSSSDSPTIVSISTTNSQSEDSTNDDTASDTN